MGRRLRLTHRQKMVYYVVVSGGNVGYNPYAVEHPEEYTTNGVLAMVASPTITMHSNAVEITGF